MAIAAFDEMMGLRNGGAGSVRDCYAGLRRWLDETPAEIFDTRRSQAELFFRRVGITFAVYGEEEAAERLIPFDIVPRIISGAEWRRLTQGIEQRVQALNAFLDDIYHRQEILRAGRVPRAAACTLLATVAYAHFYVEHNKGHHARVATPDDPALEDGFYWLHSRLTGTHPFLATARNYGTDEQDVAVVEADVADEHVGVDGRHVA